MQDQIDITVQPEDDLVDLNASQTPIPSETVADRRAIKAHIGMGESSPGLETIKADILAGNEDVLRKRLATDRDLEFRRRKLEVIQNMTSERAKKGGRVTQEEADFILGLSRQDFQHDPATILESEYARNYFNRVARARDGDNPISKRIEKDPERGTLDLDIASNIKMRQEMAKTKYEDLEDKWKKTSFFGKTISYGSQLLISPLESYRLHDVATDSVSFLPGNNLSEQVQFMWTLPPTQFKAALDKATDELAGKNILTAMKFVESVVSFSSSDQLLDNVFGIISVADLPLVTAGKLVKGAGKAVRSVKDRPFTKATQEILDSRSVAPETPGITPERKAQLEKNILSAQRLIDKYEFEIRDPETHRLTTDQIDARSETIEKLKFDIQGYRSELDGSAHSARVALKDAVKAESSVELRPLEEIHEATGDIESAAIVSTYKEAKARLIDQDPLGESQALFSQLHSWFNIKDVVKGRTNLAVEATRRLSEALHRNASLLMDAASDTSRVNRLSGQALDTAFRLADAELKSLYPHLGDATLGVSWIRAEQQLSNVAEVELQVGKKGVKSPQPVGELKVVEKDGYKTLETAAQPVEVMIGTPEATLFKSRDEAFTWADRVYRLHDNEYKIIKQKGNGFYISIRKAIDETKGDVRDQLMVETRNQTPRSLMNTFIGLFKNPEDTLSQAQRESRHAATHGGQELHRYAKEVAESIGGLSNKSKKKLLRILQENRDTTYEENGILRRGVFYRNLGEFEKGWTALHGKPPSEKEALAYFSAIQINDWDWMFRNLGLVRDKARQGIERHRFTYRSVDDKGETVFLDTPFIEGRRIEDIEWENPEYAGIWLYDKDAEQGVWFSKNAMTAEERARVVKKVKEENYHIIQVANPLDKPLRKIAGNEEEINFIVVPGTQRSPLDWKQLDYRPGGHVEYVHNHWVKQVKIRTSGDGRNIYEGDVTLFNQATEAEAKKFAEAADHARLLLKAGKEVELEDFLAKNLPFSVNKWKSFFKEVDGEPPRLTLNEPIRHTVSGRNLLDTHPTLAQSYENFTNNIRSTYNLYGQIDKKYTSQRDPNAWSVRERQGKDEPLFRLEDAAVMDPLSTLNKGMANVMRSRYLNDYKIQSVEAWIQEFHDVLKVEGGLETLRRDPVHFFHNAEINTLLPNKDKIAAAQNSRRAVLELLGTESELGGNLRWMQEKLLNSIYGKLGQGTSDWIASHLLPLERDPLKYARGVAFHSKLGLFNPVQLWLQAQTLAHVTAVAGVRHSVPGLAAAALMRRLSLTRDQNVINHFADISSKLGWKREDFIESYNELRKTGLWSVEGEVAVRDDYFDPKLFHGSVGKFLDKGTFFFREGERISRLTAWNAAYREWKASNPGKAIDSEARNAILARQNTLSVNMTRASNAWWQQGVLSIPSQFMSYQIRLMEQFLGKRLTGSEKAHAFLTYSAMYGVPTAVGAAAGVWPWYEDIRQAALERDLDVNSPGMKMLMEGIPATVMSLLTATDQNWSQRYGPGGLSFFKDVFVRGKIEQVFGASVNIIGDMIGAVDPIARGIVSIFSPESGEDRFEFIAEDSINAAQQIGTLSNVGKAFFAMNTGRFFSKNETYLGEATTLDAIMTGIAGTMPLEMSDAFIMSFSLQQQQKAQAEIEKAAIKYFRRGLQDAYNGDETGASANFRNARLMMIGGGFRVDQQQRAFEKSIAGHESFVEKIRRDFYQKAPADSKRYRKMFNLD